MGNLRKIKKLAIIASDNGIGHIKRSAILANKIRISYLDIKLSFYVNIKKLDKLKKEIILQPNIQLFNYAPNIEKILKSPDIYKKILNSLPSLGEYDLIISDNLPEVLLSNKNTMLFANFLWGEILIKKNKMYFQKVNQILKKYKPILIQNYLFGMNISKSKFSMIKKLYFYEFSLKKPIKNNKSILLSIGNTDDESIKIKKIINDLKKLPKDYIVYIEPRLYNDKLPSNFKKMKYTSELFLKIQYAIIRPGLGTIYSCLENQILMFLLKSNNQEITHNNSILLKSKLALDYDENFKNSLNSTNVHNYKKRLSKLNFFKKNDFKNSFNLLINKNYN